MRFFSSKVQKSLEIRSQHIDCEHKTGLVTRPNSLDRLAVSSFEGSRLHQLCCYRWRQQVLLGQFRLERRGGWARQHFTPSWWFTESPATSHATTLWPLWEPHRNWPTGKMDLEHFKPSTDQVPLIQGLLYSCPGLFTNSIVLCWLLTIKDRCKKLRFQQTHNQGLHKLLLNLSWDLHA